jgi:SAM-dependent methyltransferase
VIRILDVGAGPLTAVGRKLPGREVDLVAVDPLADAFDRILSDLGIDPPTRTRKAAGEALLPVFGPDQFDIVVCGNALDHSHDPALCVGQMFAVTRPGGWMYLWHYANEAEEEGYAGLHQWNLEARDGDMILWNRSSRVSCRELLGPAAEVDCHPDPAIPRGLETRIRKRPGAAP